MLVCSAVITGVTCSADAVYLVIKVVGDGDINTSIDDEVLTHSVDKLKLTEDRTT